SKSRPGSPPSQPRTAAPTAWASCPCAASCAITAATAGGRRTGPRSLMRPVYKSRYRMRAMSDPARAEPIVPRSGHGPGVLVLTAGALGDALARDALVRLAHHGFVAFAVDLPVPSGASRAQRAPGE